MRKSLRNTRNTAVLEALFPKIRQRVLAVVLNRSDRWWFLSELAHALEPRPSSLQRELSSLVTAGILEQRPEGARIYFRARRASPFYKGLQEIFEQTARFLPHDGALQPRSSPALRGMVSDRSEIGVIRQPEVPKSETLPTNKNQLALARRLDNEIRREWEVAKGSLIKMVCLLHKLREGRLWMLLTDRQHKRGFKRFDDYMRTVCGKMSRTKLQDLLAIHGLLMGPTALSAEDVEEMGPSRARQLARLKPEDRTADLIDSAKTEPVTAIRQKVQQKMNSGPALKECKEALVPLTRKLLRQTVELIEEVEQDAVYLKSIRGGDTSVNLCNRVWHSVFALFAETHAAELAEARHKYRLAVEAKDVRPKSA